MELNGRDRRVDEQSYVFNDEWKIHSVKSHILTKKQEEEFVKGLKLPHIPDMLFAQNLLEMQNQVLPFAIVFNAHDALKHVNDHEDLVHVAMASEWLEARKESSHLHKIVHPYDWTFSPTGFKGAISDSSKFQVETTDERIDYEKLKQKEKILFYDDVILYEDELDDNGCSKLSVKIRVMPSGFFCLLRFYLRVDNTLIRVIDCRLYYQVEKPRELLREYSERENRVTELNVSPSVWKDQNEIVNHLTLKTEIYEKILLLPTG